MASAVSGSTGSFGELENSMFARAVPSVNYTSVIPFEPSGDLPVAMSPLSPSPTSAGCWCPVNVLSLDPPMFVGSGGGVEF
ncbi:hypothetical protein [Mycolicibacterium sarraceniae]|uniref:hypothetical protein n=1 Tax=Mycolicibacterium sarraceniae TaxID=1534348 RepID=UPI0013D040DE|nr:hypothetical protein [Mycolicibacterium sarraceniae]